MWDHPYGIVMVDELQGVCIMQPVPIPTSDTDPKEVVINWIVPSGWGVIIIKADVSQTGLLAR